MTRLDTDLTRDRRPLDTAVATPTGIGTGAMVALLLGVLLLAMLALWAIAQPGQIGDFSFGFLDSLAAGVRRLAGTPHYCQVNTC